MKAFTSLHQDRAIVDTLRGCVTTLTNNQIRRLGGLELKKTARTVRSRLQRHQIRAFFSIHFDKDYGYIDRIGIISELDERVKTRRWIGLSGIGGVGQGFICAGRFEPWLSPQQQVPDRHRLLLQISRTQSFSGRSLGIRGITTAIR